jgi:RNA polymerase sigma-70 factor, ECF subfamily
VSFFRPDPDRALQAHGPLVWALCRRLDPEPEDAWQECWEKVIRALPRFTPDGAASLRTWITTIVHRHLVDRHRRRVARGAVVDVDEVEDPAPSPMLRLVAHDDAVALERALQRLPDAWRRVVVLHHLYDLPLEQIAAEERVALGTVKSRLHRARAALAEELA